MKKIDEYDALIDGLASRGENITLKLASEILGVSRDAVRSAAYKRNFKFLRENERTIIENAESMSPSDAVNYLLGVIGQYIESHVMAEEIDLEIRSFFPRITRYEFRLFKHLYCNPNVVMKKETLLNALYYDTPDVDSIPEIKIIDVYVCKIRKKLDPAAGEIVSIWGEGYKFVPAMENSGGEEE